MDSEHADGIADLYERLANRYIADRSRGCANEQAWLNRFLAGMRPESERRVLDIGCGAGAPIGKWLMDRGCKLTGIDTSPTLIAHCRRTLPAGEWSVADMRRLNFNRTFDGLIAWDSFFHLKHDDQRRMFGVFEEHAAPGAMLMFTSGPEHGTAMGSYHGEPLYHASLAADEYQLLLSQHGFVVVEHVTEDPMCGDHTIWLARFMGEEELTED